MNAMNDKTLVQTQYKSATNLNARISIHDKYSVNKQGWGNWILSNYEIDRGMRVPKEGGMFVCKCPNRQREYLGKVF